MSAADDDELDARLGALRVDPPGDAFAGRLRGALDVEARRMHGVESGSGAPTFADLDARLSALKVEPPENGFDRRLRAALEEEASPHPMLLARMRPWIARVAVVLVATLVPVAVYAAGMHIARVLRGESTTAPASTSPPAVDVAPVRERTTHRVHVPAPHPIESAPPSPPTPTIVAPPAIDRLAPPREHLRPAHAAATQAVVPESPASVAAPAVAPAPIPPTPPSPGIERLHVDLRAPHREADLRPIEHEVGDRPPPHGPHDGRAPNDHGTSRAPTHRPPVPGDSPPDGRPPRERPGFGPPGDRPSPPRERPMPPPDRSFAPPPMERPMMPPR